MVGNTATQGEAKGYPTRLPVSRAPKTPNGEQSHPLDDDDEDDDQRLIYRVLETAS